MADVGGFYAIRQCRTKVVGSRFMTLAEADREVREWRQGIGPAVVVPATPELARAVRYGDQAVLAPLLATRAVRIRCFLRVHPRSTVNEVAAAEDCTRERAIYELRQLKRDGVVFDEDPPPPTTAKYPRRWSVTP